MIVKDINEDAINRYLAEAQAGTKVRRINNYEHLCKLISDACSYLPSSALIYNNTLEGSSCIMKVKPVKYDDYAYPYMGTMVEFTMRHDGYAELQRVYRDDLTRSAYNCHWTLSKKAQKRLLNVYQDDNRVKISMQ